MKRQEKMNNSMNDSLDDDDNGYVNFAAKFKALRKQNHDDNEIKQSLQDELNDSVPCVVDVLKEPKPRRVVAVKLPSTVNTETIISIPHNNLKETENRIRNDSDRDLEITSVEEVEKCKSDVLEILDDSTDIIDLLENDDDHEKYEINIKVLWRSERIHRFTIQQHENFEKVFQFFADLENISIDRVLIMKKEKSILCTETPATIQLSVIDILEGGMVEQNQVQQNSTEADDEENNMCQIKVQSSNKQFFVIPLKMDDTMESLLVSCAKQLNVEASKIKLLIDGEQIEMTDTPESLEFEQEACVDLRIID